MGGQYCLYQIGIIIVEKQVRKDYATKTIIIHILAVVQKHAREEHPASFTEIARYLSDSGKPCDRRTVARNIDYLIADGFPIGKTEDGKCFYKLNKNNNR